MDVVRDIIRGWRLTAPLAAVLAFFVYSGAWIGVCLLVALILLGILVMH